eukprot:g3010.t1
MLKPPLDIPDNNSTIRDDSSAAFVNEFLQSTLVGAGETATRAAEIVQSKLKDKFVNLDNKVNNASLSALLAKSERAGGRLPGVGLHGEGKKGAGRPSMGRNERQRFFNLFDSSEEHKHTYDHYVALHKLWQKYARDLIIDVFGLHKMPHQVLKNKETTHEGEKEQALAEAIMSSDLHGAKVRIIRVRYDRSCVIPESNSKEKMPSLTLLIGMDGIVVQETKSTFVLAMKTNTEGNGSTLVQILKRDCDWLVMLPSVNEDHSEGNWCVTLFGKVFSMRRRAGVLSHKDKKGQNNLQIQHKKKVKKLQRQK